MSKHFPLFIKENEANSSRSETYFVNSSLCLFYLKGFLDFLANASRVPCKPVSRKRVN